MPPKYTVDYNDETKKVWHFRVHISLLKTLSILLQSISSNALGCDCIYSTEQRFHPLTQSNIHMHQQQEPYPLSFDNRVIMLPKAPPTLPGSQISLPPMPPKALGSYKSPQTFQVNNFTRTASLFRNHAIFSQFHRHTMGKNVQYVSICSQKTHISLVWVTGKLL